MKPFALLLALAILVSVAACDFGFPSGPAQTSCHFATDCPRNLICAIPPGQTVGQCELNVSASRDSQGRTLMALKRRPFLAADQGLDGGA
jgi:hypothetical protein